MSATAHDLDRLRLAGAADEVAVPFDRLRALNKARKLLAPSLQGREAPDYPLTALGSLAPAAAAIAEHGQMQPALVGQSLLGAASLLVQGLFNVRTANSVKPLSLYLLTLGESGDGKSTADGVAMHSIKEWQREADERYQAQRRQHAMDCKGLNKGDAKPDPPRSPYRLVRDATVEGLRRDLEHGPVAQGLFTDEAASVLAGYGMSAEQRSKTAATLCGLWDTGDLSVSRSSGGRVELQGRRLAMHWLIQPHAAEAALIDPKMTGQGFWPRFLLAWPAPCEPRKFQPFRPELLPAVVDYWRRCRELLSEPLPGDCSKLPTIEFEAEALQMIGQSFESLELQSRRGRLHVVKPFGLRATEQACRIAGVLAAFAGRNMITAADARGALELTRYSLSTWRAVINEGLPDSTGTNALRLFEWLTDERKFPDRKANGRCILRDGPTGLRLKEKRDAAVDMLAEAGLVKRGERGMVIVLDPPVEKGGIRGPL